MKIILQKMAEYNKIANNEMLSILGTITGEEFTKNIGSYFKSFNGILNHIANTDILWLQ